MAGKTKHRDERPTKATDADLSRVMSAIGHKGGTAGEKHRLVSLTSNNIAKLLWKLLRVDGKNKPKKLDHLLMIFQPPSLNVFYLPVTICNKLVRIGVSSAFSASNRISFSRPLT